MLPIAMLLFLFALGATGLACQDDQKIIDRHQQVLDDD
jgi:hypothetical protein